MVDGRPEIHAAAEHVERIADGAANAMTGATDNMGQHLEGAATNIAGPANNAVNQMGPSVNRLLDGAANFSNASAVSTGVMATVTIGQALSGLSARRSQTVEDRRSIQDTYGDNLSARAQAIEKVLGGSLARARRQRPTHVIKLVPVGLSSHLVNVVSRLANYNADMLSAGFADSFRTMQEGVQAAARYVQQQPISDNESYLFVFVWFDMKTPLGSAICEQIRVPFNLRKHDCWFHANNTENDWHFGLAIDSTIARADEGHEYIFRGPYDAQCFTGIFFYGSMSTFGVNGWRQFLPRTSEGYLAVGASGIVAAATDLVVAHPVHFILLPTGLGFVTSCASSALWQTWKLFRTTYWTTTPQLEHLFQSAGRQSDE